MSEQSGSIQDVVNRRIYSSARLVRTYARTALYPPETEFLARYRDQIEGRILELGCGAGRITRHLAALGNEVVGIDVSPAMVEYCRRLLPAGTFLVGDLRNLSGHADAGYGLVVAGANVLDAVPAEDRLRALPEIRRVLAPGGLFYFSGHNRNSKQALDDALRGPKVRLAKDPYRQLRAAAGYVRGQVNHRRFAPYQRFERDHAILNDDAHGWRLLHYYIDRAGQERQLEDAGFETLETFGRDGGPLAPGADDSMFTELHYVARVKS